MSRWSTGVCALALFASPSAAQVLKVPVGQAFTYQGELTDGGSPATGAFDFAFVLYDAAIGGASVGAGPLYFVAVAVDAGRFTVDLDFGGAAFDGQARWLEVLVKPAAGSTYTTLSPRQRITATPYSLRALSVEGPLVVVEDVPRGPSAADPSAAIEAINVHTASTGQDVTYGLYAEARSSAYVSTPPIEHSAGVLGRGIGGNYVHGVRGESGDLSGLLNVPLGSIGVVGLGQNRGAWLASVNGIGAYGRSESNYGVWGQSEGYRGVTGRTSRTDNNYGLYTPDNLYSMNYNLTGATMQVVHNGGNAELGAGDVVVFHGIHSTAAAEVPIVSVARAERANDPAVAGVVYSRFDLESIDARLDTPEFDRPQSTSAVTPDGPAGPGDYLLVVISGPARMKVDPLGEEIRPGDLLATAGDGRAAGRRALDTAMKLPAVEGASFAKALETVNGNGVRTIHVFVTLR